MKLSIVQKISLSSIFLMLLSAGVVGGLFYVKGTEVLVEHALEKLTKDVQESGQLLRAAINNQRDDTLFLANTAPIRDMLRARSGQPSSLSNSAIEGQWIEHLAVLFEALLERKETYLRIRLIDEQGQELVNVAREGSQLIRVNDNELQNKSHRPYVRDTLKLPVESVYVSAINLNREFGKVVVPHQEVLRVATPVYAEKAVKPAGLVIITVEIGHDLHAIQEAALSKTDSEIYITNDRGGYLLHPDVSKAYGFDLGQYYRIQEDFPYLADLFLPDNPSQQLTLLPADTQDNNLVNFIKIPFDSSHPEHFIAVVMSQDYASIVAKETGVLNEVMLWALLMLIGGVGLGVLFAQRLSKPIQQMTQAVDDFAHQRPTSATLPVGYGDEIGSLARSFESMTHEIHNAQESLRHVNDDLEKMVSDRTRSLEDSEVQQRMIVENIVDAVITIDEDSLVSSFNPAAENIFGYKADEVIGKNVSILLPESERKVHEGYTKNSSLSASRIINQARDLEGRKKDGSIFPLELNVAHMELAGRRGFVGILRDITERERMIKMKNEFVSTVSHELRTPLTSINGSLSLISAGAVGEFPDKAKELLRIAGNNTTRLLLLINDILDVQKVESGEMSFVFQRLELMPFMERVIQDNQGYGDQHNVGFKIMRNLDGAFVYADPDRLMQVMSNLLSNAVKFSPDGGTVELHVSRYGKSVRIAVTDHGSGIPKAFQAKLFEKFTQADSTDTRQVGGTGLGLSIAKAMVEKHAGQIDFISTEGVGTTFFVDIPELTEKADS